jgi:acyl-homoserine lactone acylase PvdQ
MLARAVPSRATSVPARASWRRADGEPTSYPDAGAHTTQCRAKVRWTSYGIPHYLADDMPSVAYAAGYVESRDVVCILADQFVRLRAERSRYFGPARWTQT